MHFKAITIPFLAATVHGWRVTFYAGLECRSANLGGIDIALGDPCFDAQQYNGIAQSVTITQSDGDRPQDAVAFFSEAECPLDKANAVGDDGCLSVGAGIRDMRSISVVGGDMRKRAAEVVESAKEVEREIPEDEEASDAEPFQHGALFEQDGELWRWHQIAQGAWRGIPAHEWTKRAYVANTAPMPEYGDNYPFDFEAYHAAHPGALERTNETGQVDVDLALANPFNPVCRALSDCLLGIGMLADFYFPRQTRAAVNAIEAARQIDPNNNRLINFLQNPIVLTFGGGIATGYITARITGPSDPPPSDCAAGTGNEDAAVIEALINQGLVSGDEVNAIKSSLRKSSTEHSLSAALVPRGEETLDPGCNAPGIERRSSLAAVSRVKRDLFKGISVEDLGKSSALRLI